MITFTMKILGYSAGAYTVEYIPNNDRCKPVKLNIQLDSVTLENKDLVLEKLKASSPQDYWATEINSASAGQASNVAFDLLNTAHNVTDILQLPVYPVTAFSAMPPVSGMATQPAPVPSSVGQSTPEQVASQSEQNIIKLKILIQQVLQEMAEGTV